MFRDNVRDTAIIKPIKLPKTKKIRKIVTRTSSIVAILPLVASP